MNIYLVRHGESVGNLDPTIYQNTPDHMVELSENGFEQAKAAGAFLRDHLTPKNPTAAICQGPVRIWTSPYQRARQTAETIFEQMGPLVKDKREDILLCEQQFGLFDGIPDEELPQKFPAEHAHYQKCEQHEGRFWARMPLGESRFDVALRTRMFFGTIMRDAAQGINNVIVVCHGVTIRAFIMSWMHYPYEWIEKQANPLNCSTHYLSKDGDQGVIYPGFEPGKPALQ